MEHLEVVLANSFTAYNISLVLFGTFTGIIVGVLPGLSSVMGLTLVLPFTFSLEAEGGFFMLLGVFCGSIYGGSITAILINTPGTANSVATCLDGYPMAKRGEPGRALSISTMASAFGGLFSAFVLIWTAPWLAKMAVNFASPEYFALAIFGLTIVTRVSSKSIIKSLIGAVLGLFFATVGLDLFSGMPRFTLDTIYLTGGVPYIPLMIGMYAFTQGMRTVEDSAVKREVEYVEGSKKLTGVFPRWDDVKTIFPTLLRSSAIGSIIGAIPGTGGDIASWVAYNEAKRWSKRPEMFGTGIPEGIAAPEAANNAISGGALIPLLTMGIPGDAGTAVMLGAFMMHGIVPGPLLFRDQGPLVYTIIAGFFLANIFFCIMGYAGLRFFAKIPSIPNPIILPAIFLFCVVGTFAMNNNIDDVYFMMAIGIAAFLLIKLDFSMPPVILGLILGNITEKNLVRSLNLSDGSFSIFFTRPISCILMSLTILTLVFPMVRGGFGLLRRMRK